MDVKVIYSSFIAGTVKSILGHPFDTVKTRIQLFSYGYKKTISQIYKKEGLKSFYKGISFPLASGCLQNCFMFSTENYLNRHFNNHIITGVISGSVTSVIVSPSELVKCHIQNEKKKYLTYNEMNKRLKCKNIHLGTGMLSTIIRDSIGMGIYFGLYNYLKSRNNNPLINGGISGSVSWLFSYPIDVIKTNKQIKNDSYLNIIKNIELSKYTKGLSIVLLRSFIVNAGIFYTYERLLEK